MAEPRGSSNGGYIGSALAGGSGDTKMVKSKGIGRGQKIVTSFGMDNVDLACDVDGTTNGSLGGSTTNLSHSLKGASAVDD